MDSVFPKEHVTEILSESDHLTRVAPTTLIEVVLKPKLVKNMLLKSTT